MSYYFAGFDVYKSSNLQAVKDYIDFVDQRFKLVMFTEYFDESLVLLRRTMNWSMAGKLFKFMWNHQRIAYYSMVQSSQISVFHYIKQQNDILTQNILLHYLNFFGFWLQSLFFLGIDIHE